MCVGGVLCSFVVRFFPGGPAEGKKRCLFGISYVYAYIYTHTHTQQKQFGISFLPDMAIHVVPTKK